MAKTSTQVAAGIIKLALTDVDNVVATLRAVQKDLGTNAQLAVGIDRLVAANADLNKFADKLRG